LSLDDFAALVPSLTEADLVVDGLLPRTWKEESDSVRSSLLEHFPIFVG
jgi:hypothetical protein